MQRLCERPGCSEPASVAYGMRAEDLVFWLDVLRDPDSGSEFDPAGRGVLCRRHADSMVMPRDWTLDDLRDPDLHLFRPPSAAPPAARATRRRASSSDRSASQLSLGVEQADDPASLVVSEAPIVEPAQDAEREAHAAQGAPERDETGRDQTGQDETGQDETGGAEAEQDRTGRDDADSATDEPWTPSFDTGDDLDGLLAARSPLLARAFRGTDRTKDT